MLKKLWLLYISLLRNRELKQNYLIIATMKRFKFDHGIGHYLLFRDINRIMERYRNGDQLCRKMYNSEQFEKCPNWSDHENILKLLINVFGEWQNYTYVCYSSDGNSSMDVCISQQEKILISLLDIPEKSEVENHITELFDEYIGNHSISGFIPSD